MKIGKKNIKLNKAASEIAALFNINRYLILLSLIYLTYIFRSYYKDIFNLII